MLSPSMSVGVVSQPESSSPAPPITAARFRLCDSEPLPVEMTLRLAERFRRGVMGSYRLERERRVAFGTGDGLSIPLMSPILSGKDGDAEPLAGHRHTFYLPTDEDRDGFIDHMTAHCEAGFGEVELDALKHLRWLWADAGRRVQLDLIGLCGLADLSPPLAAESAVWVSATPFIASRHPKRRGRRRDRPELLGSATLPAFVAEVLLEEFGRLRARRPDLPVPESIAPILNSKGMDYVPAGTIPARRFTRCRLRNGESDTRRPFGTFRVVFPRPVRGPFCLGRSCHFGMGLFVPEL